MSANKASHRATESGKDGSGLGHWAWTICKGKGDITSRVVVGCRPCRPSTPGSLTVHAQHQRHLNNHNDDREPRVAFMQDLSQEITQWLEKGDQLIVMLDANEDICGEHVKDMFSQHGL